MDLDEFIDNYLNTLLDKISKENKSVFLLGDFNTDLLKHDKHAPTNEFLDSLSSHTFLPHIVQPNRISTTSKTLIDTFFKTFILQALSQVILPHQLQIIFLNSFFQNHVNDLKNTWKGIKRIISLKDSRSTVPSTIIEDNISLTNPKDIADAFNNYFSNVATGIKSSIKYSRNKFFDFLPQFNINSFFINPTDKTEIKNIIFLLIL